MYLHFAFPHCLLPPSGRDYSSDVSGCPTIGQVPSLHHDPGYVIHHGNRGCAQCSLPVRDQDHIGFPNKSMNVVKSYYA